MCGTLEKVDPGGRNVTTSDGATLSFDSLLVAVGARSLPVHRHAITFGADGAPGALAGLLADLQEGYAHRVAFVVPSGLAWSLPLYELAIITARHVWGAGIDDVHLTFVTPEARAARAVRPGAQRHGRGPARRGGHRVHRLGHRPMSCTTAWTRAGGTSKWIGPSPCPVPAGPAVPGLPDTDGFIPVDEHGLVEGLEGVYAAGDATDSPIKQGGLAGQQAVVAAEAIAASHGADVDPQPYRPVLRGMLLTGGSGRWLRRRRGRHTDRGARVDARALVAADEDRDPLTSRPTSWVGTTPSTCAPSRARPMPSSAIWRSSGVRCSPTHNDRTRLS